jgi:hypothetical protein
VKDMGEHWIFKDLKESKSGEVYTPREFRGLLASHIEAIDTCVYRIREHLKTGLPLDRELISREVKSIKDWAESILEEMKKVTW